MGACSVGTPAAPSNGGDDLSSTSSPMDASSLAASDLAAYFDLREPADLVAVADLARTPYPAGPYGNAIGDTIPPLVWEGYVDPKADAVADTKPYGSYSMDALRMSGAPYGLVHVSEFY